MIADNIPKEYSKRINVVVGYILKNLTGELSLNILADIANYSPFHFQKIFKQVIGETPKQFIIRMRLENSAHYLITHSDKSITEIALDSGFASPSTFSRAFKNYFGIRADEMRNLSPKQHIQFRQKLSSKKYNNIFTSEYNEKYWTKNLSVTVSKISSTRVVFVNVPLSDTNKIQEGFNKIIQLAEAHDLLEHNSKFIGIINPHAGFYQAAVTIQSPQPPPKDLSTLEIEGGKFAVLKIKGNPHQIFHAFHAFYDMWLSKNAYRIKQHFIFEILTQHPQTKHYDTIVREVFIPIEPA